MNETFIWLRVKDLSAYTGYGISTLNHLRQRGDGPPYVLRAQHILYRKDLVDKWLNDGMQKSTSQNAPALPRAALLKRCP